MKVLLAYPEFPDTYWSFRHALRFENKRSAIPPLGLLTVSAMLPGDWERRLVDLNLRPLTEADIAWADLVMTSAMLVQRESLRRVVAMCKERGKRVVVGGPYVSTSIEPLPGADHIFIGESETTLPEFIRDLARGEAKPIYRASEKPSLAATPVPDFHLTATASQSLPRSGLPGADHFHARSARSCAARFLALPAQGLHRTSPAF